jgi:hypothetical protein
LESTIPTPTLGLHQNPFGLLSNPTVSEVGVFALSLHTTNIVTTIHTMVFSNVSFPDATMVQFLYLLPRPMIINNVDTHNLSSIHHLFTYIHTPTK